MIKQSKPNKDEELISQILEKALDLVLNRYLESGDFNGFCAAGFVSAPEVTENMARSLVGTLFDTEKIIIRFSGNPHIKAFLEVPTRDGQQKAISGYPLSQLCLYPAPEILQNRADVSAYHNRPYTKALILGCGQLDRCFFKSEVLERYTRNPLYNVEDDGTSGKISTKSELIDSNHCDREDEVFLSFGHGYSEDENRHRLVVAFPRYLHNLSPRHQLHWNSYRVSSGLVDQDFIARSYQGEFTDNISVYDAILRQLLEINALCAMIGESRLFKNAFDGGVTDPNYGPMKRPSLRAFREFTITLRKVVLDNMNMDFFKERLKINEEGRDKDGKKITKTKSVVRLLGEWFTAIRYRPATDEVIPSILDPFKNLNKTRNAEAHSIYKDELDNKWIEEHKKMITSVYHALDGVRTILSTHPKAKGKYSAPEALEKLMIKY